MSLDASNETRRRMCTHLGAQALASAPRALHSKFSSLDCAPPDTPQLPFGSLWGLINHLKVLHQYVDLVSEAASHQGPHATPLSGQEDGCVGGLEWFAPLLSPLRPKDENEYQRHVDSWRQANPGLYSHAEAAYHVHQGYVVEDMNMTRFLVSQLLAGRPAQESKAPAQEYEAHIAADILRARPGSFDEFSRHFLGWRKRALYHLLCLAARHMPTTHQWAPPPLLHQSQCWQELLDTLNQNSFCTDHRLQGACEQLAGYPALSNHVCALLDRLAVLARVKSDAPGRSLDEFLPRLRFERDAQSPYAQCQRVWGSLKTTMQECLPPSLLCPALYPPNRDTWGYRGLQLRTRDGVPYIHTGPLAWLEKDSLGQCKESSRGLPDRLHDIILRMGEAATAPEVAHLMLSPRTLRDALAGGRVDARSLPDFADRGLVLNRMDARPATDNRDFSECIQCLVDALPKVTRLQLPVPAQLLAWRVDCPPRAILYEGDTHLVDLSATPPYRLPKSIWLDKVHNRTVSGISVLTKPGLSHDEIHGAIRACIAEEVVAPHADFADHPFHVLTRRPQMGAGFDSQHAPQHTLHTTTLAEAVSFFTGPPPQKLSEVPLHASVPWDADHVDDRYAERQVAGNGSRFRDWVTVYHDQDELQRCRLASHAVAASELYQTHFPLVGQQGQTWVQVTSTLPAETVVLRRQAGKTDLESLRRSVDMRFMHDGKLLPVRQPGDRVEREHMEIYTDASAKQVLVAYAPRSADGKRASLEFVSFAHAK